MKTEFICEICGKRYDTPKAARDCEDAHKATQKRDDLKAKSEATISELVERHIRTFREAPSLNLSDEAANIVAATTVHSFTSALLAQLTQLCNICDDKEKEQ